MGLQFITKFIINFKAVLSHLTVTHKYARTLYVTSLVIQSRYLSLIKCAKVPPVYNHSSLISSHPELH